jgi:hypothetical protein
MIKGPGRGQSESPGLHLKAAHVIDRAIPGSGLSRKAGRLIEIVGVGDAIDIGIDTELNRAVKLLS